MHDAYNANPDSMAAALRTLATMTAGGRGIAVLGEMAELGDGSAGAHRVVGKLVGQGRVSWLVAAGSTDAAALADEARRQWVPTDLVDGPEEAARVVERGLRPGDVVLVKGSNITGLLSVAARLADFRP